MLDEIVPMTSARKKDGIPYVHVFNPGTKRSYDEPLLMVDHLPVQDATTFLNTAIDKVSSVGRICGRACHWQRNISRSGKPEHTR